MSHLARLWFASRVLEKKPPENGGDDEDGQNTWQTWTFRRRGDVPVVRYLPASEASVEVPGTPGGHQEGFRAVVAILGVLDVLARLGGKVKGME